MTGVDPEGIPEELKDLRCWICWESVQKDGGTTKKPRAPWTVGHTGDVSPTNPWNWTGFDEAYDWASKMPAWGVGFVFSNDGPYVGVDLDDCVEGGTVDNWAADIVTALDSYTEFSPSGTGMHVICRGQIPHGVKNEDRGVELYDNDRFFTFTGDVLADRTAVTESQGEVDGLVDEYMQHSAGEEVAGEFDENARSQLYGLKVSALYPGITPGQNVAHPEHGSGTGANFKIHSGGGSAICWRGEHQYGTGDGCGLGAQHLLAMKATGMAECDEVRTRWEADDGLVFETWLYAAQQEIIDPQPIPWRARLHAARELGLEMGEGRQAQRVTRIVQRYVKEEHGIDDVEVS